MTPGSDLRGARGPGPQASRRHWASHQTLHIIFLAHDFSPAPLIQYHYWMCARYKCMYNNKNNKNNSCLPNCDLILMHACVRHASARLARFIDQFIASLDQRLYKLISYWLVSLAALVACQHYPQKSYWQLPRHSLIRTQMISTIHLLTSYVTLPSLLIYSKTMSQETSALSYFCTN